MCAAHVATRVAFIAGIMIQGSGCTLYFATRAGALQGEDPVRVESPSMGEQVLLTKPGAPSESVLFLGDRELTATTYRAEWLAASAASPVLASVPMPGDTIRVSAGQLPGTTQSGIMVGFVGLWSPSVRFLDDAGLYQEVALRELLYLERSDGSHVDAALIRNLAEEGYLPNLLAATIRTGGRRDEVNAGHLAARPRLSGHHKATKALLLGLAVDAALLYTLSKVDFHPSIGLDF